jgi:phage terminase large subunit
VTKAQFPAKLRFLFDPHRYKVAYGGRGSGKSWGFARALVLRMASSPQPLRVLCAREVQDSIRDSVHRLLADQISALGLGSIFEVQEKQIKGPYGSLFLFAGLQQHTVESIKSFEGVDVVWVEEAANVSKRSWDVLIPTIRKPGSEIWISFNPDLDTDETYQRFVVSPPPDCVSVQMNYMDNPWFPSELEEERKHCARTRPTDYANIWLGRCRGAVDGAIYTDEVNELVESGRFGFVPYEPTLKVHVVVDLGWNDAMAVGLFQRVGSEMRTIEYFEAQRQRIDQISADLRERRYNWGRMFLPHDAEHGDAVRGYETAKTVMESLGWEVIITPSISVEEGILMGRAMFARSRIDRDKAGQIVERMRRYRRHINKATGSRGAPLHDDNSHGADVWRYAAINANEMVNDDWGTKSLPYKRLGAA